ncbi:MAG: hypothetical protein ABR549_17000 [Mycobacteriales bacterium]
MRSQVVILCLTGFGVGSVLAATPAAAYHTNFTATCSNPTSPPLANSYKRSAARAYSLAGRYEGYQWGGGCWNDNDRDESPGDPTEKTDTRGEGGDCSGFTNKTWRIKAATDANRYQYTMMDNHHAEGTSTQTTTTASYTATTVKSYSSTMYMDAFVHGGHHIGMIYTQGSSGGTDTIIEAKGESYGTILASESYRGDANYEHAVIRKNWTPECWPSCVT